MGLRDLKKRPTASAEQTEAELKALEFIGGAALISASEPKPNAAKPPVYKRTTFSLTEEINQQIDLLSLSSRAFRVSRSDVIRAGVMALQNMPESELLTLLAKASRADVGE